MSGYGGCDDEAIHAMVLVDNEVERVRIQNNINACRTSATYCNECSDIIPQARRELVPGVLYCVQCAPKYQHRPRVRLLDHIL